MLMANTFIASTNSTGRAVNTEQLVSSPRCRANFDSDRDSDSTPTIERQRTAATEPSLIVISETTVHDRLGRVITTVNRDGTDHAQSSVSWSNIRRYDRGGRLIARTQIYRLRC